MANDPAAPWRHLQRFGLAVALAIPGSVVGLWLGEVCRSGIEEWLWPLAGVVVAIVTGVLLANAYGARPPVHRALRAVGLTAVVLGIPAAVWLFLRAAEQRGTGAFLAGLGETIGAWFCLFAVASGAALWLAGWAGKHAIAAATPVA